MLNGFVQNTGWGKIRKGSKTLPIIHVLFIGLFFEGTIFSPNVEKGEYQ